LVKSTTLEHSMNKKLISLAVAAALVAPAAAMADATLYGKLNVSLDYVDVTNVVLPIYNENATANEVWGNGVYQASILPNPIPVGYVDPTGGIVGLPKTTASGQVELVKNPAAPNQTHLVAPGQVAVPGKDFSGWGMGNTTGGGQYIQNSVVYNATLTSLGIPVTSAGGGRSSRLGVKGSEDLGGGLKAIYQIELGINVTDTNSNVANNNDQIAMRNTFVGLAGGWGTALMGRHDTPMKISTGKLDLFADTLADNNATVGFHDVRADNAVAYISPAFSGFTFAAAVVPAGGATAITGNQNSESSNINEGYSLAGIYSNGPFYASVAYESLGYQLFNSNATQETCAGYAKNCLGADGDWNKWRFGLGLLDWNGFTLDAIYEQQTGIAGSDMFSQGTAWNGTNWVNFVLPTGPDKMTNWQIQAGYAFGNSMVKAMYGASGFDSDNYTPIAGSSPTVLSRQNDLLNGDRQTWAVGFDHNFSKRTKVYALYTDVSDDRSNWIAGSEWSGFSLGMMHSF